MKQTALNHLEQRTSLLQAGAVFHQTPFMTGFSTLKTRLKTEGSIETSWFAQRVDDPIAAQQQAQRDLNWLSAQVPSPIQWLKMDHTNFVWDMDEAVICTPERVDAAITTAKNSPIGILTADCVPIILYEKKGRALAVIHAGWKGLASHIIHHTVEKMHTKGSSQLCAWVGPCIYPYQYEVGEELFVIFKKLDPSYATAYHSLESGKGLLNLPLIAQLQLQQTGVQQVIQSGWCTHSYSEYWYSHRRQGERGRIATVAWLHPSF